jgi:exodeoxyribonuclease-5
MAMVKRLMAREGHAVAVMAGYAGTGKTFLLKAIAETFGVPVVIAPTGKAAARVKEMAGLAAMTIHRWLYEAVTDKDTGTCTFDRKAPDQIPVGSIGLLVVEESSMVSRELWNDIVDTAQMLRLKVLLIGDPFQLSPVERDEKWRSFSVLDPSAGFAGEYTLLTEIQRQALDSPIIRVSMAIRAGDVSAVMTELSLVPALDFMTAGAGVQRNSGVILCYKNSTRHWINEGVRTQLGFTEDIQDGEPVVVLKNNYGLGVNNGETYRFRRWEELTHSRHTVVDKRAEARETTRFGIAVLEDVEAGTCFRAVVAQEELFGRMKSGTHAIGKAMEISFRGLPQVHANLGYGLTCHKAQGSEWNEVLIAWEPSLRFWGQFRDDALRWAYTAITRAKTRCYISLGATAPNTL